MKWEYSATKCQPTEVAGVLASAGEDGWEAWDVHWTPMKVHEFRTTPGEALIQFKRPKPDKPSEEWIGVGGY